MSEVQTSPPAVRGDGSGAGAAEGEVRRLLGLPAASAMSLAGPQLIRRMLDAASIAFDQEKVIMRKRA